MPWDAAKPNLGFTTGMPWLPLGPGHAALAVSRQEEEPGSCLNYLRTLMRERTARPQLREGGLHVLDAPLPLIAFVRGESLLCVFNLGAGEVRWTPPDSRPLDLGTGAVIQRDGVLILGPFSAWFGTIEGL
jgi:alpha-glucosidase